jgi:hypothetical protein
MLAKCLRRHRGALGLSAMGVSVRVARWIALCEADVRANS